MKILTIILDSDGILCDPVSKILPIYNAEYGTNIRREDIVEYDMRKFQLPGTSIIKYFNMPGFFRHVPLVKDAQIYVEKLVNDGHHVFIATKSPKTGIIDKYEFFEEYFPFVGYDNIIPIGNKELLYGDVILEDCPDNVTTCRCEFKFILDCPWNENMDMSITDKLSRVYEWEEFYQKVTDIAMAE